MGTATIADNVSSHITLPGDLGSTLRCLPLDPVDKVRYAVRRGLNTTMTEFARRLGFTRVYVYQVLAGRRPGLTARGIIAQGLGVEVSDIWPASELESSASVAQGQG
jgi:lambda repressor-like predicted transcriptional regulator